jgi:phage terminase large subunit
MRASETGILDADELADAKKTMPPEQYASEFECDESSAIFGSYYGALIGDARGAGQDRKGRL